MSEDVKVEKVLLKPEYPPEYGYVRVYNSAEGVVFETVGSPALVLGLVEYARIAARVSVIKAINTNPPREELVVPDPGCGPSPQQKG